MKKQFKHLFLYSIVGGSSTIVEWALFYCMNSILGIGYVVSTSVSYIISILIGWYLGRLILFKACEDAAKEIRQIYIVSIVGLLINLFIMWGLVDKFGVDEFASKVISTFVVFLWNYLLRKLVIYKNQ